MCLKLVMPSSHLILCRPLLLLPPIPPSIRVSSNKSTLCMRWPKYWSFSFSISPSNEHQGLISFRMDWLDLLAVPNIIYCLECKTHNIYSSVSLILYHQLPASCRFIFGTCGRLNNATLPPSPWKNVYILISLTCECYIIL